MGDRWLPTHEQAVQTQLTRNDIVHLLPQANISEIVTGCFVRVLLEIETGHEDYRCFTIRGTTMGDPYTGFSTDPNLTTRVHLDLDLPMRLRGINGVTFQLNSISNSKMNASEHQLWASQQEQGMPCGTEQQWRDRAMRVSHHQQAYRAHRQQQQQAAAQQQAQLQQQMQQQQQQQQQQGGNALMGTVAVNNGAGGGGGGPNVSPGDLAPSQTMAPMGRTVTAHHHHHGGGGGGGGGASGSSPHTHDNEEMTMQHVRRLVMEELREKNAVFVNPEFAKNMKTAHLRLVERDLGEYLDRVRECLSTRPSCVVCMDRSPTVVLLPCKHMVLCRLCATQVTSCPCCRETAVEVFEPIEP